VSLKDEYRPIYLDKTRFLMEITGLLLEKTTFFIEANFLKSRVCACDYR